MTRATASRLPVGCSTISATTISPTFAFADGVGGHQEVLVDAAILGDDEMHAALLVQAADHLAIGAGQHFDDLAFAASAPVEP